MSVLGPRAGGLRLIRIVLVCVAFGVTINSAASVVLWRLNAARVHDNCRSVHRIVQAGGGLIGSPDQLRALRRQGRITQDQLNKALGWYRADCK